MSAFTKYLDKPASMAADALVSVAAGAASLIVFKAILPIIPLIGGLTDIIAYPAAGVVAAAVYLRARKNLTDPTPAFKA